MTGAICLFPIACWGRQVRHSSEIRGLCLMKFSYAVLYMLPIFQNMKIEIVWGKIKKYLPKNEKNQLMTSSINIFFVKSFRVYTNSCFLYLCTENIPDGRNDCFRTNQSVILSLDNARCRCHRKHCKQICGLL